MKPIDTILLTMPIDKHWRTHYPMAQWDLNVGKACEANPENFNLVKV